MKLAVALSRRVATQTLISQLSERLSSNAKVQSGETTAEDPLALLTKLRESSEALEKLIAAINLTNSRTVDGGETLTELLARRDAQKQYVGLLRKFLGEAAQKVDRYAKSEIVIRSAVNVAELQAQCDQSAKNLRELDERIQGLNWTTELIEK